MPDSVTITREWFELLEGLPTVQSRWNVLYAVAGFAFDGRVPDDLDALEKSVFMNIKPKIQNRKYVANNYAKRKKRILESHLESNLESNGKTLESHLESKGSNLTSNQHINTNDIPLSCESKDSLCSPKGKKKKKFTPPTLDDVKQYIRSNGYSIDPEEFFSFYESQGWKVGKNPMKDWHRAISYWQCRQNNKFKNQRQLRDYSGI